MIDFKLHKQFLINLGVNLTDDELTALAEHIASTLSERVIDEVVTLLDDEQAEELASLKDSDDSIVEAWLDQNVTDLKEIIEDEVDIMLSELAESANHL